MSDEAHALFFHTDTQKQRFAGAFGMLEDTTLPSPAEVLGLGFCGEAVQAVNAGHDDRCNDRRC